MFTGSAKLIVPLSAAAVAAFSIAYVSQQREPAPPPPLEPRLARTAEQAMEQLDRAFQNVFTDLTLTETRKVKVRDAQTGEEEEVERFAVFGMRRIPHFRDSHPGLYMGEYPRGLGQRELPDDHAGKELRKVVEELSEQGWVMWYGIVGSGKHFGMGRQQSWDWNDLTFRFKHGLNLGGVENEMLSEKEQVLLPAAAEYLRTNPGGTYLERAEPWLYAARTIRLTKQECLSCHRDAKLGDTRAIMLYALKKTETPRPPAVRSLAR
jgi:hypothetical protein